MLHLECRSKRSIEEVRSELKRFFGAGGLGLTLREEASLCLTFEGGGGYVTATLCEQADGKTAVDLMTSEWEHPVREFAGELT